jgi:transcriptional regulator with XRE-family HTH domain
MTGVSASALGLAVGLSAGTVSMIEAGERKNPSGATLSALARALGVSLEWLIDGTGDEPDRDRVRESVAKAMGSGEHAAAATDPSGTGTDGGNG